MILLFNGCSYSEPWVSPATWKETTSIKKLEAGYIQYNFHDPAHAHKYKDGYKPVRMKLKRLLSRYRTIEEKKAAIKFKLEDIPAELEKDGFNPITGVYAPKLTEPALIEQETIEDPRQIPFSKAVDMAFKSIDYAPHTEKDVKSVLLYFIMSATDLGIHEKPICDTLKLDVKAILDNVAKVKAEYVKKMKMRISPEFSDKRYNKFIAYLSPIFEELVDNGMIDVNPVSKIKLKKVTVAPRKILTKKERKIVSNHLMIKDVRFWLFMNIYFHSGGRETELLSLKHEDVDLVNLYYRAIVRKGRSYKFVSRPIKAISVPYWNKAMIGSKKGDIIFSHGFLPGSIKMGPKNISSRWKKMVKDELGFKADFAALKHANLDELADTYGLEVAAVAAGHTTTEMVEKHYAVNKNARFAELVKNAGNEF